MYQYSRTCFVSPLDLSTENGHRRQVALQRKEKINIESKDFHKIWTLENGRYIPKQVAVQSSYRK